MKKEYLECGRVCNAHGVRGMLKVESWCDSPKVLASRKRVFLADKDGEFRETRVLASSVSGNLVLMQIEGIDTRESAIAMKNTVLFLHRSDIPLGKGQMLIADIPEGEYIVFEHGPFDFETENRAVEAKIEQVMKDFDYSASGYALDTTPGRVFYFYHDCTRYWKYIRPVKAIKNR